MTDFYEIVNLDRDIDRRHRWRKHREQTSKFINEVVSLMKNRKSVGVFGAGNCDDFDVELLTANFEKVYLLDIDTEAVERGISHLNEDHKKKIQIIEVDFVNMSDFRNEFVRKLNSEESKKKIVKYLRSVHLVNEEFLKNFKEIFNVTIVSAIYTQLFYNECLIILEEHGTYLTQKEIKDIIIDLAYVRDQVVKSFNELVHSCTCEKGYMIQWTDLIEVNKNNTWILLEFEKIHNQKEKIDYIGKLCGTYGIPSGVNGCKQFIKLIDKNEEILLSYWRWRFSDQKNYIVAGIYGQKGV
jgi:hypothetical protein